MLRLDLMRVPPYWGSSGLRDDQGERDVGRDAPLRKVMTSNGAAHLDCQLLLGVGSVAVLDTDHRRPRRDASNRTSDYLVGAKGHHEVLRGLLAASPDRRTAYLS
jgi:hypothetical protein